MGRVFAAWLAVVSAWGALRGDPTWWIDVPFVPRWAVWWVIVLLVGFALRATRAWRVGVAALAVICFFNAFELAALEAPVVSPLSVSLLAGMALTLAVWRRPRPLRWVRALSVLGVSTVGFPLLLSVAYGATDYRRPADAIVVFGAKCHADGRLSTALQDRMATACELYHQGLAPRVLLSGGPGVGTTHETEAMRTYAMAHGVPAHALTLDAEGLSTAATVAHTDAARVLAVSQDWHLPRVKLAYARAGVEAFTVPAQTPTPIPQTPRLMLREVAAFWWYWARCGSARGDSSDAEIVDDTRCGCVGSALLMRARTVARVRTVR